VRLGNDLRRLPRARQVACVDGVEPDIGDSRRELARLRATVLVQRLVVPALQPTLDVPVRFTVSREQDRRPRDLG
jgi:hypothetical protein